MDYLALHERYKEVYEQGENVVEDKKEQVRVKYRDARDYLYNVHLSSLSSTPSAQTSLGYLLSLTYLSSTFFLARFLETRMPAPALRLLVVGGLGVVPAYCMVRWLQIEEHVEKKLRCKL